MNPSTTKLRSSFRCWAVLACLGMSVAAYQGQAAVNPGTLTGMDLGTPAYSGSVTFSATTNTVLAGGADIWGTSDAGYFVYTNLTSVVWDAVVRVHDLRSPGSTWGKCELMVRADQGNGTPEANDMFIAEMTTQPSSYTSTDGAGVNWVVDQFRTAVGGNADWIHGQTWSTVSHAYSAGNPAPSYPNRWMRLVRQGSVFTTMDSTDGVNWNTSAVIDTANPQAQPAGADNGTRFNTPFPNSVWVGIAVTSHNDGTDPDGNPYFATAVFSDFSITIPSELLAVSGAAVPDSLKVTILDVPPTTFDPAASGNLNVTIDGQPATPASKNKSAGSTVLEFPYPFPNLLASGRTLNVHVETKATTGTWFTNDLSVLVPAYATIPADTKLATPATTPGMTATTFQLPEGVNRTDSWGDDQGANRIFKAEQELVGGFLDLATGTPYPNYVVTQGFTAQNNIDYVNWEQTAGDVGGEFFGSSTTPADTQIPNTEIPGISSAGYNDYIATEVVTYLRFPTAGIYQMGVASDDGFQVRAGKLGPFGTVLGAADVGRGVSETSFTFVVPEAGDYPFRLVWMEGTGGANCEWYTIDRTTGARTLINGPQNGAIKAFRAGQPRAYVQSVSPANNYYFTDSKKELVIKLADGATQVAGGSVKLLINGNDVTSAASVQKSGTTTTVTYLPSGGFPYATVINGQLIWGETSTPPVTWTNNFRFCTAGPLPYQFPAGSFWIEGEDFDYDSGKHVDAADTMPYLGGAYDGLSAVPNVDYFNDDAVSNTAVVYRYQNGDPGSPLDPYPSIASSTGAMLTTLRPFNTTVNVNYKIGWIGGSDMFTYTRKIPQGLYTAYGAFSYDDGDASPFDQPTRISGLMSKVTAGAGTSSPTLQSVGNFVGPSTGGWSANNLAPLVGSDGRMGILRVNSATTTLRVDTRSGDWDYFILMPVSNVPAKLTSVTPDLRFSIPRDAVIKWTYEDYSTSVDPASLKLKLNGAEVPAAQVTSSKAGGITTITFDPPGMFDIGKTYNYELTAKDTAGTDISTSGSFIAHFMPDSPAGMFLIEAEDFNLNGTVKPAVNTMPYLGNAYDGLSATVNIDYARTDAEPSGDIYRLGESPNVPMSAQNDENGTVRARDAAGQPTWTLTTNYRLGWAGGGRWQDYTREVPAGSYQIWASMSYGETPSSNVLDIGNLRKVTSDPTKANQTTEPIGYFRGPATGGWGANQLFPMRLTDATTGDAAVVNLGGTTTFQFEYASGDFDYMMLVPAAGAPPGLKITGATLSGGNIQITWTGGGTLQSSADLKTWSDIAGATTGSYSAAASDAYRFYRVRQ